MDSDEEEDGPLIGKKPKQIKEPNPLNEPKREREREAKRKKEHDQVQQERAVGEEAEGEQGQQTQVEPQSKIPPFGDGSRIFRDWTTSGLFDDAIDQYRDTCGSVVFTRLLQASYNKDRPIAEHRKLSYRDLAEHIRGKTKMKKQYSFSNLNVPINYLRDVGLHKDDVIWGSGLKTKGDFDHLKDATRDIVYNTLETTPLGIVIKYSLDFEHIGRGIYYVPTVEDEDISDHALLAVARGTKDGVEFLVAQNSWGTRFGNYGYCRLHLPESGRFKIYWPL